MTVRQGTITKWLSGMDKNAIVKPYFYLDWDIKNMFPTNQATWYDKLPTDKKIAWKKVIKIGYREVLLCSTYEPLISEYIGSVYDSFLQSHLQKSIRRKNKRAAIFTGDLLLEISPLKLMRRLPIIMIEDTFSHESFSTLIWLMCSMSIKNDIRGLYENQKRWILGVIYVMATLNYKEIIEYDTTDWVFSNNLLKIHKIQNINVQDMIYSVETRRCYGGMKNDDVMFQSYEKQYMERFSYKLNILENTWNSTFFKKIKPILTKKTKFNQKEWLQEGYDFHCNPYLLKILEEEFPGYNEDDHKNAIWYKSSGVNFRVNLKYNMNTKQYDIIDKIYIPENVTILWNTIRKFVRRKAWGYIQGMLESLNKMYPEWVVYVPYTTSQSCTLSDTKLLVIEQKNKDNKDNSTE